MRRTTLAWAYTRLERQQPESWSTAHMLYICDLLSFPRLNLGMLVEQWMVSSYVVSAFWEALVSIRTRKDWIAVLPCTLVVNPPARIIRFKADISRIFLYFGYHLSPCRILIQIWIIISWTLFHCLQAWSGTIAFRSTPTRSCLDSYTMIPEQR